MSTFDANLYSLITTTNMHVGSGKNNYGIIDNLIQRDILTDYPTINSSSLKGALREYFECDTKNSGLVRHVFGSEPNERAGNNSPGEYRFFSAYLLSMPVRSNTLPFLNITCPELIQDFLTSLADFGITHPQAEVLKKWAACLQSNDEAIHFMPNDGEVIAEAMDMEVKAGSFDNMEVIKQLIGEYPILVSKERFTELTNDNHLPVISRNYLENGISKNLWYEQVLPRQSRFYFVVLSPNGGENHFTTFNETINSNLIQIGGNASIGYGFSKISKLI